MFQKVRKRGWAAVMLLMALLFPLSLHAMADKEAIEVLLSDGTSQFILLNSNPCAKFEDDVLVISSKTQEIRYSIANGSIVRVKYVTISVPTGIDEMKAEKRPIYRITDDGFEATGLPAKSPVSLYDLSGVLIAKTVTDSNGVVQLPVNGKGVFIVKTNVSSFKIKK